jgi:hypothetical protein
MATRRPSKWLIAGELLVGATVTATLAALGVADLPAWAIALSSAGVATASASVLNAVTGPKVRRSMHLALACGLLAATLVGTWIFAAASASGPAFVNFIANHDVTLSGEAGAKPRTAFDVTVLPAGEEESAYCYVKVGREVWLDFHEGWAPIKEFHRPAGEPKRLPRRCL